MIGYIPLPLTGIRYIIYSYNIRNKISKFRNITIKSEFKNLYFL
jgi:hypothetical protein